MKSKKSAKTKPDDFEQFLIEIGARLRERRSKMGYTSYEQFAFEHEIGRAQYGKYEKGTEDMRLKSLHNVLGKMDISWEDFFKGL